MNGYGTWKSKTFWLVTSLLIGAVIFIYTTGEARQIDIDEAQDSRLNEIAQEINSQFKELNAKLDPLPRIDERLRNVERILKLQ